MSSLARLLAREAAPILLVTHGLDPDWVDRAALPRAVRHRPLPRRLGEPALPSALVVLAVPDRGRLREAMSLMGDLGMCRNVLVWVDRTDRSLALVPRPEWPALTSVRAECDGSAFLIARFAGATQAREVLLEVARHSVPGLDQRPGRLVVGGTVDRRWWPAGDARTRPLAGPEDLHLPTPMPPDVVLAGADTEIIVDAVPDDSPLSRPPVVVRYEPDLSWGDCASRPELLQAAGPVGVGPLDERILNPLRYRRSWTQESGLLEPGPARHLLSVQVGASMHLLDARVGVSEVDVDVLRALRSVKVPWRGAEGPLAYARTVAGLAMAGIPIDAGPPPPWARAVLDDSFVAELECTPSHDTELDREHSSVRTRRAAIRGHGSPRWRERVAALAGVGLPPEPTVSVLLATRRPDKVLFAARQAAGQIGVSIELVLMTHGFEPDAELRAQLEDVCPGVVVAPVGGDTIFGDVLNLALAHASGEVAVKMDDDDWYGDHFVADLLLALGYSGSELVGCPAEFIFVEPLWVTTRRPDRTELYGEFAAGGTLMARVDTLRSLGGFRQVRRSVDAGLLEAVRSSGGSVYRSHGLNYLLRRGGTGHTWDPGVAYFVSASRVTNQWRGFRPPPGVHPRAEDRPSRAYDEGVA